MDGYKDDLRRGIKAHHTPFDNAIISNVVQARHPKIGGDACTTEQ